MAQPTSLPSSLTGGTNGATLPDLKERTDMTDEQRKMLADRAELHDRERQLVEEAVKGADGLESLLRNVKQPDGASAIATSSSLSDSHNARIQQAANQFNQDVSMGEPGQGEMQNVGGKAAAVSYIDPAILPTPVKDLWKASWRHLSGFWDPKIDRDQLAKRLQVEEAAMRELMPDGKDSKAILQWQQIGLGILELVNGGAIEQLDATDVSAFDKIPEVLGKVNNFITSLPKDGTSLYLITQGQADLRSLIQRWAKSDGVQRSYPGFRQWDLYRREIDSDVDRPGALLPLESTIQPASDFQLPTSGMVAQGSATSPDQLDSLTSHFGQMIVGGKPYSKLSDVPFQHLTLSTIPRISETGMTEKGQIIAVKKRKSDYVLVVNSGTEKFKTYVAIGSSEFGTQAIERLLKANPLLAVPSDKDMEALRIHRNSDNVLGFGYLAHLTSDATESYSASSYFQVWYSEAAQKAYGLPPIELVSGTVAQDAFNARVVKAKSNEFTQKNMVNTLKLMQSMQRGIFPDTDAPITHEQSVQYPGWAPGSERYKLLKQQCEVLLRKEVRRMDKLAQQKEARACAALKAVQHQNQTFDRRPFGGLSSALVLQG